MSNAVAKNVTLKRVYEPPAPPDGAWILFDGNSGSPFRTLVQMLVIMPAGPP